MRRINKYVILLGTFLIISIIGIGIVYSQYKVRTLQNILPGSWQYHADRYYETYLYGNTIPDSVLYVTAPFQYKSKLHAITFRKSIFTAVCSDSNIVKFYSGRKVDLSGNLLTGDSTVISDSSLSYSLNLSSTIDTIGAGEKIGLICYSGKTDSTGITDSLLRFQVRFELEIIE